MSAGRLSWVLLSSVLLVCFVPSSAWPATGGPLSGSVWASGSYSFTEHSTQRTATVTLAEASADVTSTDANFTASDEGQPITGAGIPAETTILTVTDSSTATLSAPATASGTITATIGTEPAPEPTPEPTPEPCGTTDDPCVTTLHGDQWAIVEVGLSVLVLVSLIGVIGAWGRGRE